MKFLLSVLMLVLVFGIVMSAPAEDATAGSEEQATGGPEEALIQALAQAEAAIQAAADVVRKNPIQNLGGAVTTISTGLGQVGTTVASLGGKKR